MSWSNLTKKQQGAARGLSTKLFQEFVDTTPSQVAKYLGDAFAYTRGEINRAELVKRTSWTPRPTEPVADETEKPATALDPADAVTAAVDNVIAARKSFVAAAIAAHADGVTANEIARRAAPAFSRPTVLGLLNAHTLRSLAEAVLAKKSFAFDEYGLDDEAELQIWEGKGRKVFMRLGPALEGKSISTRINFASDALATLREAGVEAAIGESTHEMQDELHYGETVELYQPK